MNFITRIFKRPEEFPISIIHYTQWLLKFSHSSFKKKTSMNIHAEINSLFYRTWAVQNLGSSVVSLYFDNLEQLWGVQKKYIEDRLIEKGIIARVILEQSLSIDKLKFGIQQSIPTLISTKQVFHTDSECSKFIIVSDYDYRNDEFTIIDLFDSITLLFQEARKIDKQRYKVGSKNLEQIISNIALSIRIF